MIKIIILNVSVIIKYKIYFIIISNYTALRLQVSLGSVILFIIFYTYKNENRQKILSRNY